MAETTTPTTTLAPSELTLLFGDRFAGAGSMTKGKEELLTGTGTVALNDLGDAVMTVALLSLEQAGLLRLEQRTKKSLFGLIKSQTVFAVPTGGGSRDWPAGSLEQRLLAALGRGEAEVDDVIYHFFGDDQGWPRAWLLGQVKDALVARGLAARQETTKLKVLTTVTYTLPDSTRELLRGASPEPLQALLRAAEGRGPEFMKALRKRIDAGFSRRTERSSGDNDNDYGGSSD